MDQDRDSKGDDTDAAPLTPRGLSRRRLLRYGTSGLAYCSLSGAAVYFGLSNPAGSGQQAAGSVLAQGAPKAALWEMWKKRGWAREARHYVRVGEDVQCQLCPNQCVLRPGDRGLCRNRVHQDGALYTMAYGNPCTFHPANTIDQTGLYHVLPGTRVYTVAASGCNLRCLNCSTWQISQRAPEETKDPRGDSIRFNPRFLPSIAVEKYRDRLSLLPDDVVELAEYYDCASVAYVQTEPAAWYEYMIDTARAARAKGVKNVLATCGYLGEQPLAELCQYADAVNVDLKSFSNETYRTLNSGRLEPVLSALKTLRREGVWFEITNLIVPTFCDQPDMIRRMCDWLVENLGPDCPLHFARFDPSHLLTNLPPTPADVLRDARSIARAAGLRYVYVGNCPEVDDAGTTFCPNPSCGRPLIRRIGRTVDQTDFDRGRCAACQTAIAGIWTV